MESNIDREEVRDVIYESCVESQAFDTWHSEVGGKIAFIKGYIKDNPDKRLKQFIDELMDLYLSEEIKEIDPDSYLLSDPMYRNHQDD